MKPRIIYYYQTFLADGLKDILYQDSPVTHIHLSAIRTTKRIICDLFFSIQTTALLKEVSTSNQRPSNLPLVFLKKESTASSWSSVWCKIDCTEAE